MRIAKSLHDFTFIHSEQMTERRKALHATIADQRRTHADLVDLERRCQCGQRSRQQEVTAIGNFLDSIPGAKRPHVVAVQAECHPVRTGCTMMSDRAVAEPESADGRGYGRVQHGVRQRRVRRTPHGTPSRAFGVAFRAFKLCSTNFYCEQGCVCYAFTGHWYCAGTAVPARHRHRCWSVSAPVHTQCVKSVWRRVDRVCSPGRAVLSGG